MKSSTMNNYAGKKGITPEVKIYNLYLPWGTKITSFLPVGIFTLVAILLLSGLLKNARGEPPQFIGFFFLIGAAWFWYFATSIPYRMNVQGNLEIEFVSLIRRWRLSPLEIVAIKPYGS